ncbi:hypothetical protein [Paenibacillus sp. IHBB 10380]|uniref:hypothetical protein n=1 Tax=Paenibacillus sp. IHBB 10380 TaxID=1566358 RepID=UPI0005CFC79E|nr:hypothetical protein [Paenibacillus sp. IHBB 10380]AJS59499.1 hypothetical protein UB51_14675 [Paenibacillus sp. IHBB 10380]
MSEIGKRIFYELDSGYPIITVPEMRGVFESRTVDEDIHMYAILRDRDRQSFGLLELEYGQYAQDFYESNSNYRVNPETKELDFSYPDPNESEPTEPIYQTPLSEQVKALEVKNVELETKIATSDRENKNALFEIYNLLGGE